MVQDVLQIPEQIWLSDFSTAALTRGGRNIKIHSSKKEIRNNTM